MMQRVAFSTVRSSSRSIAAVASRRSLSSKPPNVGTIKRRSKTPSSSIPGRAAPGTPEAEQEIMGAAVSQEVSGEVMRNNFVLAACLVTFCGGVMYYSMHAVGQSGKTADGDPLAVLRQEAAEAAAAREKESRQSDEATAMLQQFRKGQFDPDKIEEDDVEEDLKPKKPWWKVW